jgi:hypothetical protein
MSEKKACRHCSNAIGTGALGINDDDLGFIFQGPGRGTAAPLGR